MTTVITTYKVQTPNEAKIYIGITTCSFKRLISTMKSRFTHYKVTEDIEKKTLYHHVCFELIEKGALFSILEEYECKPGQNIQQAKFDLMTKHTANIDPTILIKPKRPFRPEYRRAIIDKRYRETHRQKNNMKQREKKTCDICHGKYTRANRYNHLATTKHAQAVFNNIADANIQPPENIL